MATKKKPAKRRPATKKRTAKAPAKKATKKRLKQSQIPGTERKKDEVLSKLADQLYDAQMARAEAKRVEDELRAKLLEAMVKGGCTSYVDPDLDISVEVKAGKDKVVVKKRPGFNGADDADDE